MTSRPHAPRLVAALHVVAGADGGWDVRPPGDGVVRAHAATRAVAVERARTIAGEAGGGEVRVHDQEGRIVATVTAPPLPAP